MNIDHLKGFLASDEDRVGRYELLRELGRGGMAVVFEAHDPLLDRPVAVKVLKEGNTERLRLEATAAGRLRHPNIVTVHEVSETFIVMDYIAGRTLAEMMGELSSDQRLELLACVARAVDHAHRQGVIHRDLKPGNILLQADGQPVLTDFGLAKISGPARPGADGHDATEAAMGTPAYMAPEQVRGKGMGPATDVWALGVLLYEMLSGRRPFEGRTSLEAYDLITRSEPSPLPGALGAVARKALEKDPLRRYPSAAAFADDLARARRGERVKAPRWRFPAKWSVATALVVAAAVAAINAITPARSSAVGREAPSAWSLEQWRRAEDDATRALARAPDDIALRLERADTRSRRASDLWFRTANPLPYFDAAEADLTHVLRLRPDERDARALRGQLRTMRGHHKLNLGIDPLRDLARGAEDLSTVLDVHPDARTWLAMNLTIRAQWRTRQGEDGRGDLEAAHAHLTPADRPGRLLWRGRVRALLGRFDEADADFGAHLRIQPDRFWGSLWRGMARAEADELALAESHLDRAVTQAPAYDVPLVERGNVRSRRGNVAGAVSDWNAAIRLNPSREAVLRASIQLASP